MSKIYAIAVPNIVTIMFSAHLSDFFLVPGSVCFLIVSRSKIGIHCSCLSHGQNHLANCSSRSLEFIRQRSWHPPDGHFPHLQVIVQDCVLRFHGNANFGDDILRSIQTTSSILKPMLIQLVVTRRLQFFECGTGRRSVFTRIPLVISWVLVGEEILFPFLSLWYWMSEIRYIACIC